MWLGMGAKISIHAAREGGDHLPEMDDYTLARFQSTPPVKAATLCACYCCGYAAISIHAAREGGDEVSARRKSF